MARSRGGCSFFYLSIFSLPKAQKGKNIRRSIGPDWRYRNLVDTYGVRRFFADLDAGRSYVESGIVAELLRYCAGEGFGDLASALRIEYRDAAAFRNRHLVETIRGLFGK